MNTPTILKKILDTKVIEVQQRSAVMSLAEMKARAFDQPEARGFYKAMQAKVAAGLPAASQPSWLFIYFIPEMGK